MIKIYKKILKKQNNLTILTKNLIFRNKAKIIKNKNKINKRIQIIIFLDKSNILTIIQISVNKNKAKK